MMVNSPGGMLANIDTSPKLRSLTDVMTFSLRMF